MGTRTRHKIKKRQTKNLTSKPNQTVCLFFFLSSSSSFSVSGLLFTMKRRSEWSSAFFGWLSPSRVLSAGSEDMSPSPSARISAAAPGRSRSASHSAGCLSCDLWCTNPSSPGEKTHGKSVLITAVDAERSASIAMFSVPLLLTSLQDWMAMYSAKIFLAFDAILDCDLIFLYSSHASQNSRFSSLNSVRRKALKAARPSRGRGEKEGKQEESWLECHGNLAAEEPLKVSARKNSSEPMGKNNTLDIYSCEWHHHPADPILPCFASREQRCVCFSVRRKGNGTDSVTQDFFF